MLESALEAGLSAAGVDIRLLGPMPTPAIAYLTRSTRARVGIVISASHNPYADNGIKFFRGDGSKLPDALELAIERKLAAPCACVPSARLGKARRLSAASRRYMEYCKTLFGGGLALEGLHLALDCAHGATYAIAPLLFEELGARVSTMGVTPDGVNINRDCGATSPAALQRKVLEVGADLGIAFDGDGDRVILVDGRGAQVDGDELLYIIARARRDTLNGAVVGTAMSNLGLQHALRELGLELHRAPVGDRYVIEELNRRGLKLGGETSGHLVHLDYSTTGDGIVTAMHVLQAMLNAAQPLHQLKQGMHKYPQQLVNVELDSMTVGADVGRRPAVHAAVREAEHALGDAGRVLLRPSGTEPLLRILVEGPEAASVQQLAEQLALTVREVLRQP